MMRNSNEQNIKDVLKQLMETYRLRGRMTQARLQNEWGTLVGEGISSRTKKLYLSKGKLYLGVDSAPLKQELGYMKEAIIAKLNKHFGENTVKELILL